MQASLAASRGRHTLSHSASSLRPPHTLRYASCGHLGPRVHSQSGRWRFAPPHTRGSVAAALSLASMLALGPRGPTHGRCGSHKAHIRGIHCPTPTAGPDVRPGPLSEAAAASAVSVHRFLATLALAQARGASHAPSAEGSTNALPTGKSSRRTRRKRTSEGYISRANSRGDGRSQLVAVSVVLWDGGGSVRAGTRSPASPLLETLLHATSGS